MDCKIPLFTILFCLTVVNSEVLPSGITLQTSSLSLARAYLQSETVKQYAFFVGGAYGHGNHSGGVYDNLTNAVDIYDSSSKTWSLTTMKSARVFFGLAGLKDVLIVAGGMTYGSIDLSGVEIWNVTSKTWSTTTLSSSRSGLGM